MLVLNLVVDDDDVALMTINLVQKMCAIFVLISGKLIIV